MGASGSGIEGKARPLCLFSAWVEREIPAIFGDTEGNTTRKVPLTLTALHAGLTNAPRVHIRPLPFQRIAISLHRNRLKRVFRAQVTGKDGFRLPPE